MSPVRFLVTPRKESLIVTTKLSAIFLFAWRRGICGKILDLTICNPWPRQPKAHKKPDFVLGSGKNQGKIAHSDTQKPFLCSERPKTGVPKAKKAQKPRFCAREEGDWHREAQPLPSCKSPRARIPVLGTSGAHWPARWPRFVLTERLAKVNYLVMRHLSF